MSLGDRLPATLPSAAGGSPAAPAKGLLSDTGTGALRVPAGTAATLPAVGIEVPALAGSRADQAGNAPLPEVPAMLPSAPSAVPAMGVFAAPGRTAGTVPPGSADGLPAGAETECRQRHWRSAGFAKCFSDNTAVRCRRLPAGRRSRPCEAGRPCAMPSAPNLPAATAGEVPPPPGHRSTGAAAEAVGKAVPERLAALERQLPAPTDAGAGEVLAVHCRRRRVGLAWPSAAAAGTPARAAGNAQVGTGPNVFLVDQSADADPPNRLLAVHLTYAIQLTNQQRRVDAASRLATNPATKPATNPEFTLAANRPSNPPTSGSSAYTTPVAVVADRGLGVENPWKSVKSVVKGSVDWTPNPGSRERGPTCGARLGSWVPGFRLRHCVREQTKKAG